MGQGSLAFAAARCAARVSSPPTPATSSSPQFQGAASPRGVLVAAMITRSSISGLRATRGSARSPVSFRDRACVVEEGAASPTPATMCDPRASITARPRISGFPTICPRCSPSTARSCPTAGRIQLSQGAPRQLQGLRHRAFAGEADKDGTWEGCSQKTSSTAANHFDSMLRDREGCFASYGRTGVSSTVRDDSYIEVQSVRPEHSDRTGRIRAA